MPPARPVPPPDPNHVAEAAEPEVRFRDVLSHVWWCFQCFGVVRRDALLRTSRHGNYWGADKVLLAELALLGRFHQVREQLFAQRIHNESSFAPRMCTSWRSTSTPQARAACIIS